MTGAVMAAAASAGASSAYAVTVATLNPGIFGYSAVGPTGALNPAATFSGKTITQVASQGTSPAFQIIISEEAVPQNFFRQVVVEIQTAGSFRLYTSASATYNSSVGSGITTWAWGGSNVWSSDGITRRMMMFK